MLLRFKIVIPLLDSKAPPIALIPSFVIAFIPLVLDIKIPKFRLAKWQFFLKFFTISLANPPIRLLLSN